MKFGHNIRDFLRVKQFELGPAWQWRLAQIYLTEGLPNCFRRSALVLTEIWQYLKWRAHSRRDDVPPNETSATLARIDRLNTNTALVATLKLMVLAGCSLTDICQRTGLDRITFEIWRRTFFDIEARRKFEGWISAHVIEPEIQAGNHRLAAKLQFAFGGGVHIAAAILRAETGFPKDEEETKQFMEIEMVLRLREALMVPFESESKKMQQVKLAIQWLVRQERMAVAKARAEARAAEEHRRLKVAEYRNEFRSAQEQKKEQIRVDRMRERLEIANATDRMRELLMADLEQQRQRDQEEVLVLVSQSPLSKLRWKSSKSPQPSTEPLILSMPPDPAERSGAYTATYLDRVDLVATTEEVQHFTAVFVGSDVDQIQVSIPAVNVCDWSMLP